MSQERSRIEQAYAKNLGAWIREVRTMLGMSLVQLGAEVGVHRNTVWRWECGRSMPNVYQYSLIKRLTNRADPSVEVAP